MKTHTLKCDPAAYEATVRCLKTFEIRKDDRGFEVGDLLHLQETKWSGIEMRAGAPLEYTTRNLTVRVTHKLTGYGITDGWCCLSHTPFMSSGITTHTSKVESTELFAEEAFTNVHLQIAIESAIDRLPARIDAGHEAALRYYEHLVEIQLKRAAA